MVKAFTYFLIKKVSTTFPATTWMRWERGKKIENMYTTSPSLPSYNSSLLLQSRMMLRNQFTDSKNIFYYYFFYEETFLLSFFFWKKFRKSNYLELYFNAAMWNGVWEKLQCVWMENSPIETFSWHPTWIVLRGDKKKSFIASEMY